MRQPCTMISSCGPCGPRTVFIVEAVAGTTIRAFSKFPLEDEVMFRLLSKFIVERTHKNLIAARKHLDPASTEGPGRPDQVFLTQQPLTQEERDSLMAPWLLQRLQAEQRREPRCAMNEGRERSRCFA